MVPASAEVALEVVRLLGECGFDVREVERYDVAGPAFESYRYFVLKR